MWSDSRKPIVLTSYGPGGVDGCNEDPRLINVKQAIVHVALNERLEVNAQAQDIIKTIRQELLGAETLTEFDNLSNNHFYPTCFEQSLKWLEPESFLVKAAFNTSDNEQLQMHLGGTHLMLFPLLCTKAACATSELKVILKADDSWVDEEILTNVANAKGDDRIKLKIKPDAWLQVDYGEFKLAMFHFEHKTKCFGQARRKSILMSQLSWRRLFLAALVVENNDEQKNDEEKLKSANKSSQDILFWYASLDETSFVVGALKGVYDRDNLITDSEVESYAAFTCRESVVINVHQNGKLAVHLMYALAAHLTKYFRSLPPFLRQCVVSGLKKLQDYRFAKSQSSSKQQKQDSRPCSSKSSGGPSKKRKSSVVSGLEKRNAMQSLLRDEVHQIATMWAIPEKSWVHRSRPFDGDHMFYGRWIGDSKRAD